MQEQSQYQEALKQDSFHELMHDFLSDFQYVLQAALHIGDIPYIFIEWMDDRWWMDDI